MVRPERALAVGEDPLVLGDGVLDLAAGQVGVGQARPADMVSGCCAPRMRSRSASECRYQRIASADRPAARAAAAYSSRAARVAM